MKILVACEESQAVTLELRKLGHEAYSADIQECSGGCPEWHIKADVLPLLNGRCEFKTTDGILHKIENKWDMIIAFPPCTYLSNAGACRLFNKEGKINHERYKHGVAAKKFFMQFYNAECNKIAIENPVPLSIYKLPKHSQEVQPYMFGHPFTKKTRLWLKGLAPLFPKCIDIPEGSWIVSGGVPGASELLEGDRRKNRSKTFPGIAKAMAEQWAGQMIKE